MAYRSFSSCSTGEWLGELHEGAASLMLGVVVLHGAGILVGSWRRHENLVRAMVTGRKPGAPQDNIGPPWRVVALLLMTVLGFWTLQWQQPWMRAPTSAARDTAD